MSSLSITRRERESESSREISTQTLTPVKKHGIDVFSQTELARSPSSDDMKSNPASSSSFSASNSSNSSISDDFEVEPSLLAEIHRHDIYTTAKVMTSRIDFQWPDSIPQKLVVSQSVKVKVQMAMVENGRFCEGLNPGKLLEITVNGAQFVPADGGNSKLVN